MNGGGKAGRLGPEKEGVAGRKARTVIPLGCEFGHRKQAWSAKRRQAVLEVLMFRDIRQIVIVETGPPAGLGVERESKRLDKMQVGAGIRAQPDDVAGVRRYLRREENDAEHLLKLSQPSAGLTASGAAAAKAGRLRQASSTATRRGMSSSATPQRLAL